MSVAAIAVLAAASCAKEAAVETPCATDSVATEGTAFTITADIADAKAGIQDGYKVVWNQNDEIAVFDDKSNAANKFVVVSVDGKKAVFTGTLAEGAKPVCALYPYSSDATYAEGTYTFEIPSAQSVSEGQCADPKALAMCGNITGSGSAFECAFSNIVSLAKVTVSAEKFSEITISGNNSEVLAGTVSYNAGTKEMTGASAKAVTLNTTVEGGFAAGDYFIAVAPSTLTKGIFLKSSQTDGGKAFKSGANEAVFAVSHILPLGNVAVAGDWIPGEMTTVEHLQAWAKWKKQFTADDTVKLGADIDMSGVSWSAVSDYKGVFDGQEHCIYNLTINANGKYVGFFGHAYGEIKNIYFGTKNKTSYDGVSYIKNEATSSENVWYNTGAIACCAQAGKNVTNIVSYIPVEITSTCNIKTRLGGVIGSVDAAITVENCKNYGNVTNNAPKGLSYEQLMGGVCATAGKTGIVFKNCENYGNVTNTTSGETSCIGGIASNASKTVAASFIGCKNYGQISNFAEEASVEAYTGGIIGYANGGDGTDYIEVFENCENHGYIYSTANMITRTGGIAGRTLKAYFKNCINDGKIEFNSPESTKNTIGIGGIVGWAYSSKLVDCENSGEIYANRKQVLRVGGIAGTLAASTAKFPSLIENCVNKASGKVTVAQTSAIQNTNWHGVGGIVGFVENVTADNNIKGCINNAPVDATFNSANTDNRICVGGIVGGLKAATEFTGCKNYGNVNSVNLASGKGLRAGGILGCDDFAAAHTLKFENNENHANVFATVESSTISCAGGLIGYHKYSAVKDNISEAEVTCANFAGAVVGWNVAADITATKVAGKVNGTVLTSGNVETLAAGKVDAGTISGTTLYTK